MTHCIVHDDIDLAPGVIEYPTLEDLEVELVIHLKYLLDPTDPDVKKQHSALPCGYCHEEMLIRLHDIEDLLAEEEHINRWVDQECTCPEDSPNRLTFWAAIRFENGVAA